MRTITCIAIDDEPMALLVIEQFCRRKGGMELTTYSEPHVGLEEIRRRKPDLVFLDIQMNSISGLEIADLLPRECCFIFTPLMLNMPSTALISMLLISYIDLLPTSVLRLQSKKQSVAGRLVLRLFPIVWSSSRNIAM